MTLDLALKKTLLPQLQSATKRPVFDDPSDCYAYGYDNSRRQALPDFVAFPETADEVQALMKICYDAGLPVVARGRGTNTTGAVVPIMGGLVISFEHMDKILKVDTANRVMVVQPGVLNDTVQIEAAKHGFFWAPDPSSSATCAVGGNLACNAAGPRALKYGSCRENTLGLKAITGKGEAIKTGVYTTKGAMAYDLTRLLIGSEGTLAVTTEATLKLTPLPETKRTMEALYRTVDAAAESVSKIMAQSVIPCALEFVDKPCLDIIRNAGGTSYPTEAQALLIIEVDGAKAGIDEAMENVAQAAQHAELITLQLAKSEKEVKDMWARRKALSPGLREIAPKKINEDVVVPVSHMPKFMRTLQDFEKQYAIKIVNFGHAGNGNLHVNLLIDGDNPKDVENAEHCLNAIFDLVISLDGCLSGEHGIGIEKRDFIKKAISPVTLQYMREIKQVFDPKGIMNPGKCLP